MGQSKANNVEQPNDRRSAISKKLRDNGLRVTAQRLAVLNWLLDHPHGSADEVRNGVKQQLGSISMQAIYGVLTACIEAGLVRRIDPAGSSGRFECRVNDNHHHVICRHCGRIEDTDCVVGERPCLTPTDNHGFVIDEAEVVFWGICPRCQAESTPEQNSMESTRPQAPR